MEIERIDEKSIVELIWEGKRKPFGDKVKIEYIDGENRIKMIWEGKMEFEGYGDRSLMVVADDDEESEIDIDLEYYILPNVKYRLTLEKLG